MGNGEKRVRGIGERTRYVLIFSTGKGQGIARCDGPQIQSGNDCELEENKSINHLREFSTSGKSS